MARPSARTAVEAVSLTIQGRIVMVKNHIKARATGLYCGAGKSVGGFLAVATSGVRMDAPSGQALRPHLGLRVGRDKAWSDYKSAARAQVLRQLYAMRLPTFGLARLSLRWLYFPPDRRWMPDFDGILSSIMDILKGKDIGLFDDDDQVAHCDGSRIMLPDHDNPRLEIEMAKYTPPPGEYRG